MTTDGTRPEMKHSFGCDWHLDQYPWECTCGALPAMTYGEWLERRRAEWLTRRKEAVVPPQKRDAQRHEVDATE